MNIAFCINRLGIIGLGVTISSLLRNCSNPNILKLWFLCAGLRQSEKNQIIRLLEFENFTGGYKFIDFDSKLHFGSLPALHGDLTVYGRLLLADYINDDQVLYFDSDLVIELDVLAVEQFDFQGHSLAAVGGGSFRFTLGNKFYIQKLGLAPDLEYFNSGVLLLNLKQWRQDRVKEKCLVIASQNSMELPSHDQSLLNIFCAGKFAKLPHSFNCEWLAHKNKPNVSTNMILHFVGSPKPWDPFGNILNNGYPTYRNYLDHEWSEHFGRPTVLTFNRMWRIRKSYIRCIYNRLKLDRNGVLNAKISSS